MDFLSSVSNQDNASFILIGFALLLAFLLSSLLVFAYEHSSRDVVPPNHFIQSMILMAIVTVIIMESIGDSMARGFGIFGALAILRFRVNITNPRNVAFIFAAMAVGIACGVNSFANAIIGTLSFCLIAFLLRLTPYGRKHNLLGLLRFQLTADSEDLPKIQTALKDFCRSFVLKRYRITTPDDKGDLVEYVYEIRLQNEMEGMRLSRHLKTHSGVRELRLEFRDTYVNQYD